MNPPSTSGLNNSIALRTEDGVAFGSVDWIQGEQLQFQASVRLKSNDVVEMRMELTGWSDTIYGLIQIRPKVEKEGTGAIRHYVEKMDYLVELLSIKPKEKK